MGTAVVFSEQLDVLVQFPTVDGVLDAIVGKVHLVVEVRQVVFARPRPYLVLVAVGTAVAVGPAAVVLLQEFLILALQVLLEDNAADLEVPMLVSQAGFLL